MVTVNRCIANFFFAIIGLKDVTLSEVVAREGYGVTLGDEGASQRNTMDRLSVLFSK